MMVCRGNRKRHRYTPTAHERVFLGYDDDKYDRCLECGKDKPTKTIEDGEGCSRNGGYE